ncbi:MAG: hypothetical protein ABI239_14105 [Aquihabitans sp.]
MTRRIGWLAFAVFALLGFVGSAIGGAWTIGIELADGSPFTILMAAGTTIAWLFFWRWVGLGAWLRAHPPLGEDGLPVRALEPVGPWGIVGRVMLSLMVIGFVTLTVWGAVDNQRVNERAEQIRVKAERIARSNELTVADVQTAEKAYGIWSWSAGSKAPGPNPYDELLTVSDAQVVDVSVTSDGAAVLIHPDGGTPPCVVVTVDEDELIRSRLTEDCKTI